MATREIAAFDEAGLELEAPQGSDTYLAKKPVHFEDAITTDSTIDGRDVAADGALAASAVQPGDIGSAAAENVTYFATTAQGALADSAIQSADIDTLAELNGIVGDATLIDTTDARLSDDRTPVSHTHASSDLTDLITDTYIVAELPAGSVGQVVQVSDGDSGLAWAATVVNTGSGATPYLVWYNGTNWTIVGK
jgi:hypothetical protein